MMMSTDALPFSARSYHLSTCTLRRIENGDRDVLKASEILATMDPWLTLGYGSENLLKLLRRKDNALSRYLILMSEELAGVACVRYPWLLGPYLELLAVFSPYQSTGIGSQIMRWIEEQARPKSSNVWVLVSSFNGRARKFYLNNGFYEITTLPDLVKPGFDEILLRKSLTSSIGR